MNVEQLADVISKRRTVKPVRGDQANYQPRDLDAAALEAILQSANWAPTHGKTEPWRFHVFAGESRQTLADFLADAYQRQTPAESFKASKQTKLRRYALLSACAISLGMKRHPGKIPAEEEVIAVACAAQNMQLTATAYGIGSFWSSSPIYDSAEMKQWLGLAEDEDRCLGFLYLGYPANDWPERQPGDWRDKVQWR